MMAALPADQRRGLSAEEAAAYCGLSRNSLLRHGPRPVKIGGRAVWDRRVLDLWLDDLSGIRTAANPEDELRKAVRARAGKIRHKAG